MRIAVEGAIRCLHIAFHCVLVSAGLRWSDVSVGCMAGYEV